MPDVLPVPDELLSLGEPPDSDVPLVPVFVVSFVDFDELVPVFVVSFVDFDELVPVFVVSSVDFDELVPVFVGSAPDFDGLFPEVVAFDFGTPASVR